MPSGGAPSGLPERDPSQTFAALVGRDAELATLGSALADLASGRNGCVAIAGELGIGKTRLAWELLRRAASLGHLVLDGRGTEFEREMPFRLVAGALEEHLKTLGWARLEPLGRERLAELAVVLPSLAELAPPLKAPLHIERYRCHHVIRLVLERVSRPQGLVLLLDDLHWADQASIELLAHLLRRRPEGPVLLLLAYRPRQAPRALLAAIEPAMREGGVTSIELAPFTESEAAELLGDRFDERSRRALFRASGGNPFYLEELARAARGRGVPVAASRYDEQEVPRAVRSAIARELAIPPPAARAVLQSAAVVGEPFDPDVAAAVAEVDAPTALAAIDELVKLDLVRTTATPRRFAFRHPIVRRALYESIEPERRSGAHARAAAALAGRGAPATARAHHVERSARRGDEEAIGLLSEAGQAVSARAPATAARWLRAALRLLPDEAPVERRLALLESQALALGAVGRSTESRAVLADAMELVPDDLPVVHARIAGAAARLDHLIGRRRNARRLLTESLRRLGGEPSDAAIILKLELAVDHWLSNELDAMAERAAEARDDAHRLGDRALYAEAAVLLNVRDCHRGAIPAARQSITEAQQIVDGLADAEFAMRVETFVMLGVAAFSLEHYDAAARHLRRGIAIARGTHRGYWFVRLTSMLGMVDLIRGRLAEASEAIDAAVEAALLGDDQGLAQALGLRCWCTLLEGDLSAAVSIGERALRAVEDSPGGRNTWAPGCALGVACIEAGDPERGRAEILRQGGGAELPVIHVTQRPFYWTMLAHAEVGLGRVEAASEWLGRADGLAQSLTLTGRIGDAQLAHAEILLADDDPASAAGEARRAAESLQSVDRQLDAARARMLLGRAHRLCGESGRAAAELERAHATFTAQGAARHAREAAAELRRLGRPAPRRRGASASGQGLGALSGREREVAELVARGLTNRAIAGKLLLSEKTVERHLTRIFRKLALTSRAALAAQIEGEIGQAEDAGEDVGPSR